MSDDAIVRASRVLDGVTEALARLANGRYRTCDVCNQSIDDDLLVNDPLRTTCAAHPQLG